MQDLELSVTICSWNTREDLRACLASLEAIRGEAAFEVIVIDNASGDGSADMAEESFPWVRLYRMAKNLGFTGGQNYAMSERKAPHAFLLNSDTVVHAGALRSLLDFHAQYPQAGIIGPKLLNPDGSLQFSCRRFPNPWAALFRNTFLGKLFPKNRFTREYLMQDVSHDEPAAVDWVSGAAMFASKDFIDKAGLLDEGYFMFSEDVDWCWRARHAGFEVMYYPGSVITHAIGRSTEKVANKMIVRFHKSMFRFYRKNTLPLSSPFVRPLKLMAVAGLLWVRAGLFIAKNGMDSLRRKLRR
ncbi:MAG: glycosyltransferase family 2 protein [Fimbriimonadaceae bacterium]